MRKGDDQLTQFSFSGDITPSALAGDVNDYDPTGWTTATVIRLESGAPSVRTITGLAGGTDGRVAILINKGATYNVNLASESASSLAANRFSFGSSTFQLAPGRAVALIYDSTSSRWRPLVIHDHTQLSNIGNYAHSVLDAHRDDTANPHSTTAAQVAATPSGHTGINGLTITYNSAASLDVGTGTCYAENGDYINNTSAITKSSLSLTNGTWYHIYIYLSSGTPTVEVVTTAPTLWKGTAYSKTGDTSRRYLGSIIATGTNTMAPFVHRVNTWLYNTDTSAGIFRVLTAGNSQTPVNVACNGVVPVTARIGILRFTNLGTVVASVGNGSTTILTLSAPASGFNHILGPWILDSSQQVMYDYNAAGGALYIDVIGFQLDR